MRHRFLLACLLLSGFSGLAYELLWVRLLTLSFGSTQLSFSTVLGVFFGGLALGSWYAGRRARRIANPVRAYALIELLTGLSALLLYPILVNLGGLFAALDPGSGIGGAFVRLLIAAPLLLVPTFLMGATLPIVTRAMVTTDGEVGRGTALIYGFNTLGAFLGTYLVTYHLLAELGLFKSVLLTVVVNLVAAAIAFAFSGGASTTAEDENAPAPEPAPPADKKLLQVAAGLTFVGGFAAIAIQVVWVRLFSIFTDGTIYGIGSVLISVLIGIAAGSILIAPALKNNRFAGVWFVALQLVTVAAVVMQSELLEWLGFQFAVLSRSIPPGLSLLHAQLALVFAATCIPAFCSGASFPLLIGIVQRKAEGSSRTLGTLYAANTVGSILGSVVTGYVLLPLSGTVATLFLSLTAVAAVATLAAVFLTSEVPRPVRLLMILGGFALLAAYPGFDPVALDTKPARLDWKARLASKAALERELVYFAEGKNATAAVWSRGDLLSLSLNGLGQGGRSIRPPHHIFESVLVATVPLTHTVAPKRALVVGLGAGVTADILRKVDSLERLEVLELEPKVVTAVSRIFPEGESPVDDPKVDVIINDARHYLRLQAKNAPGSYDLIASMPAHPWVASSIFTQEFFEIAKSNLAEGGVFSTWFGLRALGGDSYTALVRAFTNAFDDYVIYRIPEAGALYLVGSRGPLQVDLAHLEALQRQPLFQSRAEFRQDGAYFLPLRVYATGHADTPKPPPGPINTDDSAFVEVHAPRTSTVAALAQGLLPAEYVQPELVPPAQQPEFYLELMERFFGTPGGRLPVQTRAPRPQAARTTFEAVKELFDDGGQAYLEGRLELLAGKKDDAQAKLLRAVGMGDPDVANRAKRFIAMTFDEDDDNRQAALRALPRDSDVLVHRLPFGVEATLAEVPDRPFDPREDPIGWLLHQLAHGGDTLSAEQRRAFVTHVGLALAQTPHRPLLELCGTFARRHGLESYAQRCEAWSEDQRRRAAAAAANLGRAAGARGRFAQAARHFERAHRLVPGTRPMVEGLIRCYVELRDDAKVQHYADELRFLGFDETFVADVIARARAGKSGEPLGGEAAPTEPSMGTGAPNDPQAPLQIPASP